MPPALSRLQRQAHATRLTLSRAEANAQHLRSGYPYLHAGNERYLSLAHAVTHLGLNETATLMHDRRSIRGWTNFLGSGFNALYKIMIATGYRTDFLPEGVADPGLGYMLALLDVPAERLDTPALQGARRLAEALHDHQATVRQQAADERPVPVAARNAAVLLELLATASALYLMTEYRDDRHPEPTETEVRGISLHLLMNPGFAAGHPMSYRVGP